MKYLLILITIMLVGGCDTALTVKDVAGEYEQSGIFITHKSVLLENGLTKDYENGKLTDEGKWTIVNGEIHVIYEKGSRVDGGGEWVKQVVRINQDRSITVISEIDKDGKRTDVALHKQGSGAKIK